MEEIKAYKTSDGKIFENEKDAQLRQNELDFFTWYNDHELLSNSGDWCSGNDIYNWIIENKEMVMKILNGEIKVNL